MIRLGTALSGLARGLPIALALVALALTGWNSLRIAAIDRRITALEHAPSKGPPAGKPLAAAAAAKAGPKAGPKAAAAARTRLPPGERPTAERLADPVLQQRVAALLEAEDERRTGDKLLDSMRAQFDAFVADERLDPATEADVLVELESRSDAFRAIRQDVKDGAITLLDARDELAELKLTSDGELERILGHDRFLRLDDRLWGERDARWRER
ncbi:MAG: hypothetical protein ABMB14_14060 [Myxococcota bacterium]